MFKIKTFNVILGRLPNELFVEKICEKYQVIDNANYAIIVQIDKLESGEILKKTKLQKKKCHSDFESSLEVMNLLTNTMLCQKDAQKVSFRVI